MSVRGQRLCAAGCVLIRTKREMQGQRLQHLVSFNCHLHSGLIIIFFKCPPSYQRSLGRNHKLFVRGDALMDTVEGRGSAKGQLFTSLWSAFLVKPFFCNTFFLENQMVKKHNAIGVMY